MVCLLDMSWLFGLNKGQGAEQPPIFPFPPPPPSGNDGKGGDDKKGTSKMDAYRFDSAALERAAKDLETSSMHLGVLSVVDRRAVYTTIAILHS